MSDSLPTPSRVDLRTAYRIITTLVETLTASSDLIARMAQMLGEEAARPLQQDPAWARYLEAKRSLEVVHDDMHRFAEAASAQIELENARLEASQRNDATDADD
ncbi:MAG TPA: hypothetical protein PLF26_02825 [Blastocatellia bacterium]|nr:hypothetical protein [Blastocatellia bacterium]